MKTMNTWKWLKAALLCTAGAFVFTACDDDDDHHDFRFVPASVQSSLQEKYGQVAYVEWDREGTYYVADFRKDGSEHEVWFTPDGTWVMSEVDLNRSLANLPEAVRAGFEATSYAQSPWVVEDIDRIERNGYADLYRIEVDRYDSDVELHFDPAGTLVNEVGNPSSGGNTGIGGGTLVPSQLPDAVSAFLRSHFPGAQIVEVDRDYGRLEVDLYSDYRSIEVRFTPEGTWLMSRTDLAVNELPAAVRNAVQSRYPNYPMEDAKWVETPAENYYEVDLYNSRFDLKVSPDGATIAEIPD